MAIWPFRSSDPSPFLPSQEPGTGTPPSQDPPKYVDEARFSQALDEVKGLNSKLDQFTGMMTGFLGAQPGSSTNPGFAQPHQGPAINDVTDEEYADAVLTGDAVRIQIRTQAMADGA